MTWICSSCREEIPSEPHQGLFGLLCDACAAPEAKEEPKEEEVTP